MEGNRGVISELRICEFSVLLPPLSMLHTSLYVQLETRAGVSG